MTRTLLAYLESDMKGRVWLAVGKQTNGKPAPVYIYPANKSTGDHIHINSDRTYLSIYVNTKPYIFTCFYAQYYLVLFTTVSMIARDTTTCCCNAATNTHDIYMYKV